MVRRGSGFRFVDSFLVAGRLVGSGGALEGPQVLATETGAPLRRLPADVGDDTWGSGGGLLVERLSNGDDGTVTTQVVDPFTGELVWTVGAGIEVTVVDRSGGLLLVGEATRDEWEASGPGGALVGFDTSTAGRTWRVTRRDRLNHAPTPLEGRDLLVYSSDTRRFCD